MIDTPRQDRKGSGLNDQPAAESVRKSRRNRQKASRRRILRSTAALPALFTILNALSGFGAIHYATKDRLGEASLANLVTAAWLIFVALVCDMLDGRLARMSRRTSDFGGQLDSLSDMVSFGVAPAMLMLRTVVMAMRGNVERIDFLPDFMALERMIWCVAAVYVACAALRLARFNVENEPGDSAHLTFRGLPTPGAAATIAVLVLLFGDLAGTKEGWMSGTWLLVAACVALPAITLTTALLMVSRYEYTHVINQYIRGKRPFGYLVKITVIGVAAFLAPYVTGAVLALGYALSGGARAAWSRTRRSKSPVQQGSDAA